MKKRWEKFALKIDALSLRERALVFCAVVAVMIGAVYYGVLEPLYLHQKTLFSDISQKQTQMQSIDAEIAQKLVAYAIDPDAANRASLAKAKRELQQTTAVLSDIQAGMVAPEKMIPVLQQLLRGRDRLRLLSMKTLPVTGVSEGAYLVKTKEVAVAAPVGAEKQVLASIQAAIATPAAAPVAPASGEAAEAAVKPDELLFRHSVEIVVQGAYPDLVEYMAALEALPTRLFWGQARLETGTYPEATLTLTLYTMSLDQKWMTL